MTMMIPESSKNFNNNFSARKLCHAEPEIGPKEIEEIGGKDKSLVS